MTRPGHDGVPPQGPDLPRIRELALASRPDLRANQLDQARSQADLRLQLAQGKVDYTFGAEYRRQQGINGKGNSLGFFFSAPLPVFNRNQGEIARTRHVLTQAEEMQLSASDTVLSDVANAYEAIRSNDEVVQLYSSEYLKQAQDSRDISEYAYKRGAASLLDFLDAERSYRAAQLAYRQALASYMTALEQLKQAVGTRNLP